MVLTEDNRNRKSSRAPCPVGLNQHVLGLRQIAMSVTAGTTKQSRRARETRARRQAPHGPPGQEKAKSGVGVSRASRSFRSFCRSPSRKNPAARGNTLLGFQLGPRLEPAGASLEIRGTRAASKSRLHGSFHRVDGSGRVIALSAGRIGVSRRQSRQSPSGNARYLPVKFSDGPGRWTMTYVSRVSPLRRESQSTTSPASLCRRLVGHARERLASATRDREWGMATSSYGTGSRDILHDRATSEPTRRTIEPVPYPARRPRAPPPVFPHGTPFDADMGPVQRQSTGAPALRLGTPVVARRSPNFPSLKLVAFRGAGN